MYEFIEAEKEEQWNVNRACRVLKVSRTAYYQWSGHQPCARRREDEELGALIGDIHRASRRTYGAPRVREELRHLGKRCSRKRVARLMRALNLVGRCPKQNRTTTLADEQIEASIPDLVERRFEPGEVNRVWIGDVTYIRTWEGWMYLATVLDLGSRRVVGWAMADHLRAELVCDALKMAIANRRPGPGLIFHSDRGCQYTSHEYGMLLDEHQIRQSLGRPRQCWDNAVAESFYATLKGELVDAQPWPTRARARSAIFEYIEAFYNRRRRYSSLGFVSPHQYEEMLIGSHTA